jgi:hypothetical protein
MLFFLLPLYLTNKPIAQTGKAAAAYIAVRSCVSVTAAIRVAENNDRDADAKNRIIVL